MRERYKKEFEELDYPKIKSEFLEATTAYVTQHMEEIINQVAEELSQFMKNVTRVQKLFPVAVARVQVSLLQTSVYLNKPTIRMGAYVTVTSEEEFASMDVPADWLFSQWNNFRKNMGQAVKQRKAEQYINAEDIRLCQYEQMGFLCLLMLSIYKYIYCDAEKIDGYKTMERQETFLITAGFYGDEQMVVYQEVPEIDIFSHPEEISLEYGRYTNKIYCGKKFHALNLKHAKFIHCDFRDCEFTDTELQDAQFLQCRFYDTKMTDSILYGCYFEECVLKKTEFVRTKWFCHQDKQKKMTDNYRNVWLYRCQLSGVQLEYSDLTNVNRIGGSLEECRFIGCCTDGSNLYEEGEDGILSDKFE